MDLFNNIHPVRAVSPAAATTDNTAWVSEIIDRKGYHALTFLLLFGSLADADATFTVLVEDGDDAALADAAAVPDALLVGTEALASATFADDNEPRKIGYAGYKRYVRITVTPANNTGNAFLAIIALLGRPWIGPTINPPA